MQRRSLTLAAVCGTLLAIALGFVSIPFMALMGFAAVAALLLAALAVLVLEWYIYNRRAYI